MWHIVIYAKVSSFLALFFRAKLVSLFKLIYIQRRWSRRLVCKACKRFKTLWLCRAKFWGRIHHIEYNIFELFWLDGIFLRYFEDPSQLLQTPFDITSVLEARGGVARCRCVGLQHSYIPRSAVLGQDLGLLGLLGPLGALWDPWDLGQLEEKMDVLKFKKHVVKSLENQWKIRAKTMDFRYVGVFSCVFSIFFPSFPFVWMNEHPFASYLDAHQGTGFVPEPDVTHEDHRPSDPWGVEQLPGSLDSAIAFGYGFDQKAALTWVKSGWRMLMDADADGWPCTCESVHECFSLKTGLCSYEFWDICPFNHEPFWVVSTQTSDDSGFGLYVWDELSILVGQSIFHWRPKGRSKAASARLQREAKTLDKEGCLPGIAACFEAFLWCGEYGKMICFVFFFMSL